MKPLLTENGRLRRAFGHKLLCATALALLANAAPSMAQETPVADDAAQEEPLAEDAGQMITVTASRAARTGFDAPTPTTLISEAEFERRAANNISEVLNELPTFRATISPNTQSLSLANAGQTYLDLRGLGSQRTLVLVNGRRLTPSSTAGQVDVNVIPSSLVQNIEVVTGGASASWGSDAVAGVANIILKSNLQGIEASAHYGISERGDSENYTVSGAAGTSFMDGRGHITIGGEYSNDLGIGYDGILDRQDWIKNRGRISNSAWATNGLPAVIYAEDVQFANQAPGGLITGPNNAAFVASGLLGTTFNADGTTGRLQYGQVFGGDMIGGSQPGNNFTVWQPYRAPVERWNVLARLDFEVTDWLNFNVEYADATSRTDFLALPPKDGGSSAATVPAGTPPGVLIARIDNPFLPQSVRTTMQNAGLNAVFIGRDGYNLNGFIENLERIQSENRNQRIVVGLDGELGFGDWQWDVYYQYGRNTVDELRTGNNRIMAKYRQATDVVAGPGGQPICRSTLTNPTNGCVPFNMFGVGSPSAAALAYTTGVGTVNNEQVQQVAAVNFKGDLFDLPAGAIAAAFGGEWRKETVTQVVDAISLANGFEFTNQQPLSGAFNVKEVYGELIVPVLADSPIGRALDLQLAGRYTDYSTSGSVVTWKAGLTWDLNGQIRVRGTASRDIRAGNMTELFTNQAATPFVPIDRVLNVPSPLTAISSVAGGNPNLDPERATTYTLGVVFEPDFFEGFRFSVDYYNIKIDDVITRVDGQAIIDRCAQGLTVYCGQIDRNSDPANPYITRVRSPFLNLNEFTTSGVDFELIYARDTDFLPWGGDFVLRALATYTHEFTTTDALGSIDRSGQLGGAGVPHWMGSATLTYNLDNFSTALQGRYIGGGNIDNLAIPGTRTSANIYTVPAKTIWSLSASYDVISNDSQEVQVFGIINNLFDSNPPFPFQPSSITVSPYYDGIGRAFRFGVRFKA
jgi:iron complex outermembrane recepter protein